MERCPADDIKLLSGFDRRARKTIPQVELRIKSPKQPVFTSLALTAEPRTRSEFINGELASLCASIDYPEFARRAGEVVLLT